MLWMYERGSFYYANNSDNGPTILFLMQTPREKSALVMAKQDARRKHKIIINHRKMASIVLVLKAGSFKDRTFQFSHFLLRFDRVQPRPSCQKESHFSRWGPNSKKV